MLHRELVEPLELQPALPQRLRVEGLGAQVVEGLALAAAAPRSRLVELPGAAHMTVQTRPGEVAAILREAAGSAGAAG